MARNLHGSLSYLGVASPTPPNFIKYDAAPLNRDYKGFSIGDIWLQKNTVNIWMLTDKQAGVATWTDISSGGSDTFESVTVTTGDLTLHQGNINVTLGDVNIDAGDLRIRSGSLILEAISNTSTLRTLADGTVYGLADGATPLVDEGTVYHINDAGIAKWGDVKSSGGTVTITTTADGINLESAGGTAANSYTCDDGLAVVPDGAGNVDMVGGANITSDGATINSIKFELDDEITLTTVNTTTLNSTTVFTGTAAAGLTITGTEIKSDGTDANIDINITPKGTGKVNIAGGAIDLNLSRGVVQSDAAGVLSSNEGTAGQLLISSGTNAPAWATITSTRGSIDIGLGDNSITIDKSVMNINRQVGTVYQLVLSDTGNEITFDNASAITVTIPLNTTVNFSEGTEILLIQKGDGQVNVVEATGVTILSVSGKTSLFEKYSAAALIYDENDKWYLVGDIK